MKLLFSLILALILILIPVSAEKAYVLSLSNLDNTITYSSIKVVDADVPEKSREYKYSAQIIGFSGNIIYKTSFNPPSYGPFALTLPYESNAKKILLKNQEDKELLSISTAQFADTCGNYICEDHESYETCPDDCRSGSEDDYCDEEQDGICDPDCINGEDIDCTKKEKTEDNQDANKTKPNANIEPLKKAILKKRIVPKKESSIILIIILTVLSSLLISVFALLINKNKKRDAEILKKYLTKYLSKGYSYKQLEQALINQGYKKQDIESAYEYSKI